MVDFIFREKMPDLKVDVHICDANQRITAGEKTYMQQRLAKEKGAARTELNKYTQTIMIEWRDANYVFLQDKTDAMYDAIQSSKNSAAIEAVAKYKGQYNDQKYNTANWRSYVIALYQALLYIKADATTQKELGRTWPCACGVDGIYGINTLLTSAQVLKASTPSFHGVVDTVALNFLCNNTAVTWAKEKINWELAVPTALETIVWEGITIVAWDAVSDWTWKIFDVDGNSVNVETKDANFASTMRDRKVQKSGNALYTLMQHNKDRYIWDAWITNENTWYYPVQVMDGKVQVDADGKPVRKGNKITVEEVPVEEVLWTGENFEQQARGEQLTKLQQTIANEQLDVTIGKEVTTENVTEEQLGVIKWSIIQARTAKVEAQTKEQASEQQAQLERGVTFTGYVKNINDEKLEVSIKDWTTVENVTEEQLGVIKWKITTAREKKVEEKVRQQEAEEAKHTEREWRTTEAQFGGLVSYDRGSENFAITDFGITIAGVEDKDGLISLTKQKVAEFMDTLTWSLTWVIEEIDALNQKNEELVTNWQTSMSIEAFDQWVSQNEFHDMNGLWENIPLLEKGNVILQNTEYTTFISSWTTSKSSYEINQRSIADIQKSINEKALSVASQSWIQYSNGKFFIGGSSLPRANVLKDGYEFTNDKGTEYIVSRIDTPDRGTFTVSEKPKELGIPQGWESQGEIWGMMVLHSSESWLSPQENYLQKDMTRFLVGEYVVSGGGIFKYENGAYTKLWNESIKTRNSTVPPSFEEITADKSTRLLTLTNTLFAVLGEYAAIPANEVVTWSYATINAWFLQKAISQRVLAVMSYHITMGVVTPEKKSAITNYFQGYSTFVSWTHPVLTAFSALDTK